MDGDHRTIRNSTARTTAGNPFSWLTVDIRSASNRSATEADGWSLVEVFVAAAIWTGLDLIAVVLFLRMLSGAFTRQIPVGLFGISLLLAAATGSLAFLLGWRTQDTIAAATGLPAHRNRIVTASLSLVPVLLIGTALAPPLSGIGWGFVGCCWIATLALILLIGNPESPTKTSATQTAQTETAVPLAAAAVAPPDLDEPEAVLEQEALPENDLEADSEEPLLDEPAEPDEASLWMKRSHGSDGADSLEGMTVAEFLPRQKQTTVHLAFCPPFRQTPEIVCTPVEDESVRAKVGVVYPYGARIDLKRSGPANDHATLHIHFSATGADRVSETIKHAPS